MRRVRISTRTTFCAVVLVAALGIGGTASANQAQSRGADGEVLRARLTGAQEVPPADDDGSGRARVVVNAAAGEVCWDVKFEDITTANRGHIHAGAAGVNGGIVVDFFNLHLPANQRDPNLDRLEKRQQLDGCTSGLDPVLLDDIIANPENYYVNLHNSRFPGGAIRCQLED
jgi:hypothetical protein